MTYIPAEAEFGLLRSLYLNFSCTTQVPVSTFPLPVITTKQAVKEFWYKASLPPCHPSWWRMNPSNLTHIYYMVLGPTSQPPKWHLDRFSHFCIHCSKDPQCFSVGQTTSKIAPNSWGSGHHQIRGFLGPPESARSKRHLDQFNIIFAHVIHVPNTPTYTQTKLSVTYVTMDHIYTIIIIRKKRKILN